MRLFFDITLILVSSIIVIKSYRQLITYQNLSLSAYVIFICYIFNCLPIGLDILFGYPDYVAYLSEFERAANNNTVSIIYDIYILIAMIVFYFCQKKNRIQEEYSLLKYHKKYTIFKDVIIVSPLLLFFLLIGNINDLLINSLLNRQADSNSLGLINNLLFLSLIFFCIRIFGQKRTSTSYISLILFLLILTLVSGKRFIVAVVLLVYFYSFICSRWTDKKNINLTLIVTIVGSLFMAFVIYYITNIKVMGDFSGYIYSQLRIDFGREDVVKFVIMRELDGNPILNYRGESVLSLLMMIVPRAIWISKPYPHYRYLTAEIFGSKLDELHSGMTPSIFEMMLANFGFFGMIVAIALVVAIVKFGDQLRYPNLKLVVLIILIQLFTQSLDVVLIIFYYFLFLIITKKYWIIRKIKVIKKSFTIHDRIK